MKACLSLSLLCLIAVAHGAVVDVPTGSGNPAISTEERTAMVKKAAKAIENLGKILQGETGSISMEELQSTLKDLQDSKLFEGMDISEEYFFGKLLGKIGQTIGSFGEVIDEGMKVGK